MYHNIGIVFERLNKAGLWPIYNSEKRTITVWSDVDRKEEVCRISHDHGDYFNIFEDDAMTWEQVHCDDLLPVLRGHANQWSDAPASRFSATGDALLAKSIARSRAQRKRREASISGVVKKKKTVDIGDIFDEE